MAIPAGEHTIEFRFEPQSYVTGNRISLWAAIITYLLLIAAALHALGIIKPKTQSVSLTHNTKRTDSN
jgi:hypothetical protein